jgi:hypothetical protein
MLVDQTRKSQTGDVSFLNGAFIRCGTGKQSLTCKSAAEVELVCLSDRAGKAIWTRNFLIAMHLTVISTTIHEDNSAVIDLISRGHSNFDRTRHIDIRFFWLHDMVMNSIVSLQWIKSEDQVADSLSKPTAGKLFSKHFEIIRSGFLK